MSTEVNYVNGGDTNTLPQHQLQQDYERGEERCVTTEMKMVSNDTATIVAVTADVVGPGADSSAEATVDGGEDTDIAGSSNSQPTGTGTPGSGSGRSQKSKKRQNQKTFSLLLDMFDTHQGIGSWAEAAAADVRTPVNSYSPAQQKPPEEQTSSATSEQQQPAATAANASVQHDEWNQYGTTRHAEDNRRAPPPPTSVTDRASHSRNLDLDNLPDRPPFEVKVFNINYNTTDNDLFRFLGGERCVVNIRSDGQLNRRGTAFVSFSSQEARDCALGLNGVELDGRPLRIVRYPQRAYGSSNAGPNNGYGQQYRNIGSYQHEGGYSTLPHPRRGPAPSGPYHSYNSDGRTNRLPPQQYSSYRGRDNRRYDYDNRLMRHQRPGNNQFYPRYANRSFDSYGGMPPRPQPYHNENHFIHHGPDLEHDENWRGSGRLRTESMRSSTTDGTERHERRKLQLQPRTKPLDGTDDDLPARPTSIFGLAKPVDTYEKERQVEERLRLEDEALRAADQRLRKTSVQDLSSSEHGASIPASPILLHGHISIMKPPLPEDHENYPSAIHASETAAPEAKPGTVENVEKVLSAPIAEPEQPLVGERHVVVQSAEVTNFAAVVPSHPPPPQLPPAASGPGFAPTGRRQSFSNYPEPSSDVRSTATLPRSRNSYNRTFTRSRDSIRNQLPANKQLNIPVRRGQSGTRRGTANGGGASAISNKDKRFAAGKEKIQGSKPESDMLIGQKHLENGPRSAEKQQQQQSISKESKKHDSATTATISPTAPITAMVKRSAQQHQQSEHQPQQHSKKEKKKQAAKEMPKYVEPKPISFTSGNKYAALLDADD